MGIDGQSQRVPVVDPGRVVIGSLVAPLSEVVVTDLPAVFRADGLLGLDALQHFRVTLEFDTRYLVLRPL
ncbi:MAG: hypothetical protein M0031_10555 [Thermaerobacter sp.]|jgi:hypothetical protein|nr:hypothetical protein [Thermaerobacter sp.]